MDNTVKFTIEGIGAFEFRSQLSHVEEIKLEMKLDQFMDYELDAMRDRAYRFQGKAIGRIIKDKFGGRPISELSKAEKADLEKAYGDDNSAEAVIAKKEFWEIHIIEETYRLNMLKVKPENFDFFGVGKEKDGVFFQILAEYNKAIAPLEQKKK